MTSNFANATTNLYDPSVSSTTTLNGSTVRLDGTLHDTLGNVEHWIINVYSTAGHCLRLFISTTFFDSELVVVAPNGEVYRDDDGGGSNRPLIKIANAPVTGWYTVHVSHYAGLPIDTNFALLYGRYPAGNVNCDGATLPLVPTALLASPSTASSATPEDSKNKSDTGTVPALPLNSPGGEVQ